MTVNPGGYVVLGALVEASSPAIETTRPTRPRPWRTPSEASGAVATTSTVSETTATLGGAAAWSTASAGIATGDAVGG